MKKIIIYISLMVLLISSVFAYNYGNKGFWGTLDFTSSELGMTTGMWICQPHRFYKTGTVTNFSFPLNNQAPPCNASFRVTDSLTTGAVYQNASAIFYNQDLFENQELPANITVTENQVLYFCARQNSGDCNFYSSLERTDFIAKASKEYARHQNVDVQGIGGLWNGTSFPITQRLSFTFNRSNQYGGYIYSDGEGNMFGEAGEFQNNRKVSVPKRGEDFYFDNPLSGAQDLLNFSMLIGSRTGTVYGKLGLSYSGNSTDLAYCFFNGTELTGGSSGTVISCNVSNFSVSMDTGQYFFYSQCFEDAAHTSSCDGTIEYFRLLTSEIAGSGITKPEFLNWQSWDTNRSFAFSNRDEDIYFQLGFQDAALLECNDSIDNDGDGFIDYPNDPSCTSANDTTESPFDYVECNNGIDDDLDGFTDFPDDPSCDNATDTSEYPVDASSQQESECYAESLCLFLDQFPYTDTIAAHEWEGNTAQFVVENVFGSNRLDFDNLGFIGFDTTHNITNPNIYSNVRVSFDTYLDKIASTTEHFFIILEDADDRDVLKLRYTLTPTPQTYDISFWNGSAYEYIISETVGDDTNSRLAMVMDFDQVLKTWNFTAISSTGGAKAVDIPWSDVLASKIYKFRILNGNFSSFNWDFWIDNIYIRGRSEADSICDSWKSPYFLKESFNGKPSDCGWIVNQDVFADGTLEITDSIGFYSMQKTHDLAEEENTRYVTLTYDLNMVNISVVGSTLTFRLYDADSAYNFFTVYYRDSGDYLWYNEGGTGKVAGNITLGVETSYKFVIDLVDNTYDIYINDSKVVSDSSFSSIFANVENIQHIKIQSNDAHYILDNIQIYGSDSGGTQLIPDDDITLVEVDEDFKMCNLFWNNPSSCSTDEECVTGECNLGRCSSFDYNYCDENGHPRTSKCLIYGVTNCGLTSFKDLIMGSTGNFLLFLLFLVILMIAAYFFIMVRGRN